MSIIRLLLPGILILLSISCAIRDNEIDPLSPLHKSPLISLAFDYDSTRVTESRQDTITAVAPFSISIDAESTDFFSGNKPASVLLRHSLDDKLLNEDTEFSSRTLDLNVSGIHTFRFTSVAENGATTEQTITIILTAPTQPEITYFSSSFDTLPLNVKIPVLFYLGINDPDLISDSVVYTISALSQPVHYILNAEPLYYDTLEYNHFLADNEYTHRITAYLYDKLGRSDSLSTFITFSATKKLIRGIPPVIDSVFTTESYPVIYPDKLIQFTFSSPDDIDGNIISYEWDFDDNEHSNHTRPYHSFREPGTYTVTLSITDDSLNTVSKSTTVTISKIKTIKPTFKFFSIENDSGPAPLTITISVEAVDADGIIPYLSLFINTKPYDPVWNPVTNRDFTLETPGTYYITAIAWDDDFNSCRSTKKVIVTEPEK